MRTPALAEWTRAVRTHLRIGSGGSREVLRLAAQRVLSHPNLYVLPASLPGLKLGQMVYHPPRQPRAMSAASAAILRRTIQLEKRDVSERQARAKDLLSRVRDIPGVVAVRSILGGDSGYLRVAFIDDAGTRTPRADLGALHGYPMTLDEHPQLQPLLLAGERAGNGSRFLRDRLFTAPTHSHVSQSDLTSLAEWLSASELESPVLAAAR